MTTSGSSGRKTVFVYERAGWSTVAAMFLRRSAWVGLRPRLPRARLAMIGGASHTHMTRRGAQTLDVGLHRLLSLSATDPVAELVRRLNDFQPDFLNMYPSTAGLLAEEQLAGRLRLRLTNVTTSSEPLTPALRERLETAFGVRPTNFYATTEGLFGHECSEGSMHLFDDMCIVENVDADGDPVPAGETGARILVTNLQFAVVTADPDVREFQVIQEGDALRLRLALRDGSAGAEERLGECLRDRLAALGVEQPEVRVECVDALERSPGGKLQVVVAGR